MKMDIDATATGAIYTTQDISEAAHEVIHEFRTENPEMNVIAFSIEPIDVGGGYEYEITAEK